MQVADKASNSQLTYSSALLPGHNKDASAPSNIPVAHLATAESGPDGSRPKGATDVHEATTATPMTLDASKYRSPSDPLDIVKSSLAAATGPSSQLQRTSKDAQPQVRLSCEAI